MEEKKDALGTIFLVLVSIWIGVGIGMLFMKPSHYDYYEEWKEVTGNDPFMTFTIFYVLAIIAVIGIIELIRGIKKKLELRWCIKHNIVKRRDGHYEYAKSFEEWKKRMDEEWGDAPSENKEEVTKKEE